jgi:hypothetical protein
MFDQCSLTKAERMGEIVVAQRVGNRADIVARALTLGKQVGHACDQSA